MTHQTKIDVESIWQQSFEFRDATFLTKFTDNKCQCDVYRLLGVEQ